MNVKKILLILFLIAWVVLAINPRWPFVWMIENIMTFIAIPLTLWLERRKAFSTLSAVMIFLLLLLHSMGAHYTYSEMPGFESLSQFFGFERNHYDRFVHFMFGFLIFLPLTEVFSKNIGDKKVILALTVFIIFGVSSLYEIFEWIAAISVEPKVGFSVLGSQGDIWDAQKDMVLAHLGALLAMMFWHKRVGVLKS